MSTLIGVGKSKSSNLDIAAKEAVELALLPLLGNKPNIIFLYATFGYDFKELVKKVKEVSGGAFVVGGSVFGVIEKIDGGDSQLHRVLACAIYSNDFSMTPVFGVGLSKGSIEVGKQIKSNILDKNIIDIKGLYLVVDGLHITDPDSMLKEIETALPKNTPVFGGSASEPLLWKNTYQFFDDQILEDSAVGVVFSGKINISIGSSHGSQELGGIHTITKSDGVIIYEIDNKPAMDLFTELYGDDQTEINGLTAVGVCLGTKLKMGDGKEDRIELRVPLSSNKDRSIVMAASWKEGERIYVCQRDLELIPKRNSEELNDIYKAHDGKSPIIVFEADCLGRSADQIGIEAAEVEVKSALSVFDNETLWFGGYMHGEFASVDGVPAFHNWTGSFACFYID